MAKTSGGLEENVAGLLCYVAFWVSGLIFLLMETKNSYVRFHAAQSIVVFGFLNLMYFVFRWMPFLNIIMVPLVITLAVVFWIVLMIKAYQGTLYKLPVAGDLAENWINTQDKTNKE